MSPEDILAAVEKYLPSSAGATLCQIEKGCRTVPQCPTGSSYAVIDFDTVKEEICSHKRGERLLSSVDALTVNPRKTTLLLVEIKSWKKAAINPVTNEEASDEALKKISEKFKKKLSDKIRDSFVMLNALSGESQLEAGVDWALVFVSDLDTDPLAQLNANLLALGAFPTALTKKCNDLTSLMLGELPDVTTYYTGCHEFDSNIQYY